MYEVEQQLPNNPTLCKEVSQNDSFLSSYSKFKVHSNILIKMEDELSSHAASEEKLNHIKRMIEIVSVHSRSGEIVSGILLEIPA